MIYLVQYCDFFNHSILYSLFDLVNRFISRIDTILFMKKHQRLYTIIVVIRKDAVQHLQWLAPSLSETRAMKPSPVQLQLFYSR